MRPDVKQYRTVQCCCCYTAADVASGAHFAYDDDAVDAASCTASASDNVS